jgi:tetratricopeptide (TPR) repeat protein
MNRLDPDSPTRHFLGFIRARDYKGAVGFFTERIREALRVGYEEEVVHSSHLLIASLIAAGPDQEALDLLWQVVNSLPEDIYLRSSFAGFLFSFLNQPAQALEVLDPVLEKLVAEECSRHATFGLQGAILLALGRVQEAEHCFREMLQPSLWRMYPGAFDFRLVESLILAELMKDECEQYLKTIYQRAQETNDEGVMERANQLLSQLG